MSTLSKKSPIKKQTAKGEPKGEPKGSPKVKQGCSPKDALCVFQIDRSTLPNDVESLKDIVLDYAKQIHSLTRRVEHLEERCLTLINLCYGQSSEKFIVKKAQKSDPLLVDPLLDQSASPDGRPNPNDSLDLKKKVLSSGQGITIRAEMLQLTT